MAMNNPDPAAKFVGHATVALGVGALVTKSAGPVPGVVAALIAVVAHELLDAPVASFVSELGI